MVARRNYGEQTKEETDSEDRNEDAMGEGNNSPFSSKILDTFQTNTITPDSRKVENVE